MMSDDTMYEVANEIFDCICFRDDGVLEKYNSADGDELRDELFDHIAAMIRLAEDAMHDYAEDHRCEWETLVMEYRKQD